MTDNHDQENAMPTTIAKHTPHTPLSESAQGDPLRERDLADLGIVGAEVRHTGLSKVTVTMSVAQFDALTSEARKRYLDFDCSEEHVDNMTVDVVLERLEFEEGFGLPVDIAWRIVHLARQLEAGR